LQPSRALANISLDKWSYLAGPELTEGVVEHSEVQSLRGNPNARQQLRDLKEGAPYPPNLCVTTEASVSHPPQGKQLTRDRIRYLRLRGALPGSPCQRLRSIIPQNYSLTHYCSQLVTSARNTRGPVIDILQTSQDYTKRNPMACAKQTHNMHTRLLSSCSTVSVFESASRKIVAALSPCASAPPRISHHQEHAAGLRMQTTRAYPSQYHVQQQHQEHTRRQPPACPKQAGNTQKPITCTKQTLTLGSQYPAI
jgi:hypothetical protein